VTTLSTVPINNCFEITSENAWDNQNIFPEFCYVRTGNEQSVTSEDVLEYPIPYINTSLSTLFNQYIRFFGKYDVDSVNSTEQWSLSVYVKPFKSYPWYWTID
jgi:hypothetical protein